MQYLDQAVVPVVLQAMSAVAKERWDKVFLNSDI
jgi:hypothetical protein